MEDAPAKKAKHALRYSRHFALLLSAAVLLALTSRWRAWGACGSFGLYGAVHSCSVLASCRSPLPLGHQLLFAVLTASVSAGMVWLSLCASPFLALPVMDRTYLLLALSAGSGALCYTWLIQRFGILDLSYSAMAASALACLIVTPVACRALTFISAAGGLAIATVWWFTCSVSLWYYDTQRAVK